MTQRNNLAYWGVVGALVVALILGSLLAVAVYA